jgi:hypothetical protein
MVVPVQLTKLVFPGRAGYRMAAECARGALAAGVRNNKDDLGT